MAAKGTRRLVPWSLARAHPSHFPSHSTVLGTAPRPSHLQARASPLLYLGDYPRSPWILTEA